MKITWVGELLVPPGTEERNIAHSKALGLPEIGFAERPVLAVIGGGPSVAHHIDELKAWPGDIWISGSAFQWCRQNGIEGTFFTIDQHPLLAENCKGATKAILATCVAPEVFEELKGAEVEIFDLHHGGEKANHHATSVTACPKVALDMGYREIHFFGCDSSMNGKTHAYYDESVQYPLKVEIEGKVFDTWPSMLVQAEFMSAVLRVSNVAFKNRSEGLLKAMVEAEDPMSYDITHISPDLATKLGIKWT